jgi:CheY-like chemotaxis protein
VSDPDVCQVLTRVAEAEGIESVATTDAHTAIDYLRSRHPSVLVVDDSRGSIDVVHALRTADPGFDRDVSVIALRRSGDPPIELEGVEVTDHLQWPASQGHVRTKFRAWLLRRACRWRIAPLPEDEDERIAALRALHLLDTEAEERFDRFTREASERLGMPVALVSLVDAERQWFKSQTGIEDRQTPRDMAICSHAIHGDDVLQVTDALQDDRFADNPLVRGGPRFRFYAGMPLRLSTGVKVGTLCVLDYRPRALDRSELQELRRLSALVVEQLEAG